MTPLTRRDMAGLIAALVAPAAARADTPDVVSLQPNLFSRLAVAVRLNRRHSRIFVLDTGAERSCVSRELAEALSLPGVGTVRVHTIVEAIDRPSVRIDRLSLGGRRFDGLRAPVFDGAELGADGLIGLDVLSRFRLELDTVRQTALLDPRNMRILMGGAAGRLGSRLPDGSVRTRRGPSGELIVTNAVVDAVPVAAFIDSGSQYSIGNLALLNAIMPQHAATGRLTRTSVLAVTGRSVEALRGRVDRLSLGESRVGASPLLFADLHCFGTLGLTDRPALLIGADVLNRFSQVVMDFADNRLSLTGRRRDAFG